MTTLEAIAQETRNHAEGRPDFGLPPDDGCAYYDPDREVPVCVVGHALYDLDVDVPTLAALDRANTDEASVSIDSVEALRLLGIEPPERGSDDWWALAWLREAQSEQDGGESWGRAADHADRIIAIWREQGLDSPYKRLQFERQLEGISEIAEPSE